MKKCVIIDTMIPYMRKKRIIYEIEKKGVVYLKALTQMLPEVSISTIRRDLKELHDQGQVLLLKGGAVRLNKGKIEIPLEDRERIMMREKGVIAKQAAQFIDKGDVVYLDSGSTVGMMIRHILNKDIIAVTSNMQILESIKKASFNCIILGGEFSKHVDSTVGSITVSEIYKMHFDKAFLGASGFSEKFGYSTPSLQERVKKRAVIDVAAKSYMLVDHSKYNNDCMCKIADIDSCTLITNKRCKFKFKKTEMIVVD